jgi:hypothetical protein
VESNRVKTRGGATGRRGGVCAPTVHTSESSGTIELSALLALTDMSLESAI